MSYMNDDCDPFGVPYDTSSDNCCKKEDKKYSFKELEKLRVRELDLTEELEDIKNEKSKGIEQLTSKIKKYVEPFSKIECDKHCKWTIYTKEFDFNRLDKMRDDLNLKNITVRLDNVKIDNDYKKRIIIKLEW